VSDDARGWRIALVPDTLINAPARASPASPDVLSVLEQNGYGVLQLPPPGEHRRLLAVIADQVAEYAHHGYAVVALAPLLRRRGVTLPPRHTIRPDLDAAAEGQRLAAFLTGYDLPLEEQRRWRV